MLFSVPQLYFDSPRNTQPEQKLTLYSLHRDTGGNYLHCDPRVANKYSSLVRGNLNDRSACEGKNQSHQDRGRDSTRRRSRDHAPDLFRPKWPKAFSASAVGVDFCGLQRVSHSEVCCCNDVMLEIWASTACNHSNIYGHSWLIHAGMCCC